MLMLKVRLNKDQAGSHVIAFLLLVFVLATIGFVGLKVFNGQNKTPKQENRGVSYQALASCSNQPLTTLPTDLSKLEGIAPLGGVDTPDHTLPTDHMYMMYPYGDKTQKEVYAPADIVITDISYGKQIFEGEERSSDYRIDFYPCSELKLIYGHIDTVSEKIKSAIGTPESPGSGQCNTNTQVNSVITSCSWQIDLKISAGELIGTTDGWDLWATYEGSKGNVLSPEYYHNTDAVCPLNYWADDIKAQLYAVSKRTAEPKCGDAYVDKAGTLQGGWFAHKDPEKAKTDWSSHFSLAHHSIEHNIAQVAVAGTIADQFMYRFTPKDSGTINVEPGITKPDTTYCYQHEGNKRFPNGRMAGDGKILIKLIDDHTMQIEHKSGTCSADESFSSPTTYYR